MTRENGMCNVFTALLIGAAAGAAAGILLAPQSGEETRGKLKNRADKMKSGLERCSHDFNEKVSKFREEIESKLADVKSKLQGSAQEFASEAKSTKRNMNN